MGRYTKLREVTKKNLANVRKGMQATLPVEPVQGTRREPRIISSEEIKHYYKLALAEERGWNYDNIKIQDFRGSLRFATKTCSFRD